MFAINIPALLVLGFLVGAILLLIGYRETADQTRRHHFMGLGLIIIGIMIPITPLSWYIYWLGFMWGPIEILVIVIALIVGVFLIYKGIKVYAK